MEVLEKHRVREFLYYARFRVTVYTEQYLDQRVFQLLFDAKILNQSILSLNDSCKQMEFKKDQLVQTGKAKCKVEGWLNLESPE